MTHRFLLPIMLAIVAANANGQERFLNYIYPSVKSTITYSKPYAQKMDIYQPVGDTASVRPLIILAHSGGFTGGTLTSDRTVDSLCARFARRGYVTASIDYRLGMATKMTTDSAYAMDVMVKAMSDGKAAVRYFVMDAATTNTYRIDTNNIFVGGNSAGSILYLHNTYVHSIAECPPYMQAALLANGGIDGNSGNAGYSVKIKADINLAGALVRPSFVGSGDKPCVSAQGNLDVTVPYNSGYFMNKSVKLVLNGLGILAPAFEAAGVYHSDLVFVGSAHVPWNTSPAKLNSVDSLVKDFLYTLVSAGSGGISGNATIGCQYDAGSHAIIVNASAPISDVTIYSQAGAALLTVTGAGEESLVLNVTDYAVGTYLIKARFQDTSIAPATKQLKLE